jgi:lysozyme family protein
MNRTFERALPLVLRHEGEFANHPKDPGGATMKGVTLKTFQRYKPGATVADLKAISPDMLARIYRDGYWNAVKGDDLPAGVDYAVFDFAVNSGPGRAAKYLQAASGVAQDGQIGPATLAAVAKQNPVALINSICDARLAFLRRLETWPTFGKGWSSRVAGVRKEALRMAASEPAQAPKPVPAQVEPPAGKPALPVGNGEVFKIPPDNSKLPTSNWFAAFIIAVLDKLFGRKPK